MLVIFFFFKQKTAYEMRISDWSSDVCSSDLWLDPVEKAMTQAHCTTHASTPAVELVCPAGSLPALKAAVDNGADCVYLGFRDATNARNFAGLNFDEAAIAEGIRYAHAQGRKVFLALNTYAQPQAWQERTSDVLATSG